MPRRIRLASLLMALPMLLRFAPLPAAEGADMSVADPVADASALPAGVLIHATSCPVSSLDTAMFFCLENFLEGTPFLEDAQRVYDEQRQVLSIYIASVLGIPYAQTATYIESDKGLAWVMLAPAGKDDDATARTWALVLPISNFPALLSHWEHSNPVEGNQAEGLVNPYFKAEVLDDERNTARVHLTPGAPWYFHTAGTRGLVMSRDPEAAARTVRYLDKLPSHPLATSEGMPHMRMLLDVKQIRQRAPDWVTYATQFSGPMDPQSKEENFPLSRALFRLPEAAAAQLLSLATETDKAAFTLRFDRFGLILESNIAPMPGSRLAAFAQQRAKKPAAHALLRHLPPSTALAISAPVDSETRDGLGTFARMLMGLNPGIIPDAKAIKLIDLGLSRVEGDACLAYVRSAEHDLNLLACARTEDEKATPAADALSLSLGAVGRAAHTEDRLLLAAGPHFNELAAVYDTSIKRNETPFAKRSEVAAALESMQYSQIVAAVLFPADLGKAMMAQTATMMKLKGLPGPIIRNMERVQTEVQDSRLPVVLSAGVHNGRIRLQALLPSTMMREMFDMIEVATDTLDFIHDALPRILLGEDVDWHDAIQTGPDDAWPHAHEHEAPAE